MTEKDIRTPDVDTDPGSPVHERAITRHDARRVPSAYTIAAILPEASTAMAALHGLEALSKLLPAAKLVVLHVEVNPGQLVADAEEIGLQRLRAKREGTAGQRAIAIRSVFDVWQRSSGSIGARTTWRHLVGPEEPVVVEATKDVDLIILAKPHNLDSSDALHAAVFSHHLLLMMPQSWTAGVRPFCRHIAVGWKPDKLVDQAVLLSLPILRVAERVTLLAIDQRGADYSHDYVLRALQELGVEPELHRIDSASHHIGQTLLEESRRIGADSLIAGAYRHGQFIEEIFGGVTRELMERSEIPLFLAH